ncbi:GNAT family N-acetyltransferase [Alteribacter populi]|uniref:GNAT family N-acetyltransferase n=1 Tax=Alteribacter populi TaxID=2011011 RepID=UPI0012FD81AC|nr:GNAT family protein [Alteribacter populi]
MTNEDAMKIAEWEYKGPYDFYNFKNDEEDLDYFLNPFNWEHISAVYDSNILVGFASFTVVNAREVEVGLGLRPDLTGKGNGEEFVKFAVERAKAKYEPITLTVNVASFNERAITVYGRIGFKKVEAFIQKTNGSSYPFVKMEMPVKAGHKHS